MFGSNMLEVIVGFVFLAVTLLAFLFINQLTKRRVNFSKRVLYSLISAIVLGIITYFILNANPNLAASTKIGEKWLLFFGYGYVDLLKMIAIPLLFVSILTAIMGLGDGKDMGKIAGISIGMLLGTAAIAATVGIIVTNMFNIDAGSVIGQDLSKLDYEKVLEVDENGKYVHEYDDYLRNVVKFGVKRSKAESKIVTLPEMLKSFIPKNMTYAFTGQAEASTFKAVILAVFMGIGFLGINRKYPEEGATLEKGFKAAHKLVMRITTLVLRMTPYGIFALMYRVFSFTGWKTVKPLAGFLGASYVSIIIMFIIHAIILIISGFNPVRYFKKSSQTLLFAFTSRSSAGTLPLTISTQERQFGVDPSVASTSSSFGTSMGQNGCAGIYPAMLVTMVYATGVIPNVTFADYITVVFVTTMTSLGIAGIGGGATFAAVAVFSALGLHDWLWLTGVLVGIEALIDMARTALNVSGSMVSGLVTAKINKKVDMEVYNSEETTLEADVEL